MTIANGTQTTDGIVVRPVTIEPTRMPPITWAPCVPWSTPIVDRITTSTGTPTGMSAGTTISLRAARVTMSTVVA